MFFHLFLFLLPDNNNTNLEPPCIFFGIIRVNVVLYLDCICIYDSLYTKCIWTFQFYANIFSFRVPTVMFKLTKSLSQIFLQIYCKKIKQNENKKSFQNKKKTLRFTKLDIKIDITHSFSKIREYDNQRVFLVLSLFLSLYLFLYLFPPLTPYRWTFSSLFLL